MKHLLTPILAITLLSPAFTACEEELPTYSDTEARLNFMYYDYSGELITNSDDFENLKEILPHTYYSFITSSIEAGEELQTDTVWFEVGTMGFLSGEARTVELEQIPEGENDAVAGTHYVPFNDAQLLEHSFVPAWQNSTRVPIVVKRDASLEDKDFTLKFTFRDNGIFRPGYAYLSTHTLHISGRLSRPTQWNTYYCDDYFGTYGPVKHELMIKWSGQPWNDAYLDEVFAGDSNYIYYLAEMFRQRLEEENQKRLEQGLDVYKEKDGTPVTFPQL